jgi:hypothetical protein
MVHFAASAAVPGAGAADSHLMPIALLLPPPLLLLLLQSSPVYTMDSSGWPQPGTGWGASKVWLMTAPQAMQPCLSACCWLEMPPAALASIQVCFSNRTASFPCALNIKKPQLLSLLLRPQ